jgi:phosphocarrier protein FPr/phosphocarrier protein
MIEIASALAGWVTPLADVPDPVFADRMLGDGLAVDPVEGRVVAPAAGVVTSIHPARHAVTLTLDSGPILLIHVGLDTVALGGHGFMARVADGERVAAGQLLIEFDLDLLARRARSLVTPVIVANGESFRISSTASPGPIAAGQLLLTLEPASAPALADSIGEASASQSLRLPLAHGLHARPAARVAKLAGSFDAQAEIVAENGRAVSARSPVAMLGLGLRHGATIVIRAGGPQAVEAVAALVELIGSGMGELQPLSQNSAPAAQPVRPLRSGELRGVSAVPGMAIGPAWRLKQSEIAVEEKANDPDRERKALAAAKLRLEAALEADAQGDHAQAGIAAAHLAMVADPALDEAAQTLIAGGRSAAFAWRQAIRQFAAPLEASRDSLFAERLDDLKDLERRLLVELAGENADAPLPPEGAILIAETLYPSQLKAMADAGIAGIATAAGGATSHAAIIAAGLGLPMLVGLGPALASIEDGTPLILRGETLVIASDASALERAREEARSRDARREAARALAKEPATTLDGVRIEVFANLGSVADAQLAVREGAEGCGLLRTEFLFLDRDAPPDEAEQRIAYQQIADLLGERPLIVRTLDIGADKPARWLPTAREDNPALGLRGIRLQLARPDLLETQLRALLGVRSAGPLRIMLPMVAHLAEVREGRAMLDRLASELGVEAPELGIMVETPAAALLAESLAKDAAFFSIGTNDLSQYALARDRTNPAVAGGLDALDPAVLRLIDLTVRGAGVHDRITGVCGGLAATVEAVPILVGLGVGELSVPAGAIAETKAIVRKLDLPACQSLAAQALAAPDAAAVRSFANAFLEQRP